MPKEDLIKTMSKLNVHHTTSELAEMLSQGKTSVRRMVREMYNHKELERIIIRRGRNNIYAYKLVN
jgi:CTP-dependent riboflavin kinase